MTTDPEISLRPVPAASITEWSDTADVVIAGYGIAAAEN